MNTTMISIEGLDVEYGRKTVLHDITLNVQEGEFVTLLGPSGCGKSTLLRTVAGFTPAARGRICINGRDVTSLDPEDRGIGFVFQSYALFPHLSVAQNIGFGLKIRKEKPAVLRKAVEEAMEATGLTGLGDSMPAELSGGQQQRVAIARVLVTKPSVLLMDEPLSNLDALLRIRLRDEVQRLHQDLGITTLYVTHDQDEALALSDRIAVMKGGRFEQLDTPHAVYHRPSSAYVCEFVGSANALNTATAGNFGLTHDGGGQLYVRPERVRMGTALDSDYRASGVVSAVTFLGGTSRYTVDINGQELMVLRGSELEEPWRRGDRVECGFGAADALWMVS